MFLSIEDIIMVTYSIVVVGSSISSLIHISTCITMFMTSTISSISMILSPEAPNPKLSAKVSTTCGYETPSDSLGFSV